MIWTAALFILVLPSAASEDYCYNEPHCDPYAWGDSFPSCHPLLEHHHSPINLDPHMARNDSLGPLHLEGFDVIPPGHWTLTNDGHTVVLQVAGGMAVSGGGLPEVYHTIQLHFHWGGPATNGSEHTVDGHRYPMEMHIVNMKSIHPNISAALDDPTGLAVLGFFIDVVYADNVHFGHISRMLSSVAYRGQTTKVKPFPLMSLLPESNMIGSVYLPDLLHRGGCSAGDTAAKQLQAHPSSLQPQCVGLQRCHAPQRDSGSAPQVKSFGAPASDSCAGKLHTWTLALY
ncbi:carbonic anhydrase 15 isoform X3 [Cololabis saira]|uniref:carbonic anhydrase 15 isoform X3 n=1 Tax=Cololabis saira TaxID=129043 RepID=UPI002AD58724|nr:carbonic anhydrase 15 isoform X3 [Cololabis saira]